MNDNLTIVIQGLFSQDSAMRIEQYRKLTNNIVYSTWKHPSLKELPDYVKVVSHDLCDKGNCYCCNMRMQNLIQDSTIAWAVSTARAGIREVETEYTIKVRADEYYNLEPFVEKMMENKDKVLFGNIFVRKFIDQPYHMGDHVFGGKTKFFATAYENIFDDAHNYSPNHFDQFCYNYMRHPAYGSWPAESMLACNIMKAMGLEITKENFAKAFEVIDINLMAPFMARWCHDNQVYESQFGLHRNIFSIEDMVND